MRTFNRLVDAALLNNGSDKYSFSTNLADYENDSNNLKHSVTWLIGFIFLPLLCKLPKLNWCFRAKFVSNRQIQVS
ncbi:hypothetical protein T03_10527 [Trichinella britovi]|uniref:Uncharacterized protein n=1 Tax=Trichinella britovi TaxID=45882 RepID=A0A0V1CZ72_TRIBR|nr:hypothetical protein T03_10527 [Trichinella britovi]